MNKTRSVITIVIALVSSGFTVLPVHGLISNTNLGNTWDGNILYVGGSGLGNYSKIQNAIDNASDDDTVFVYNDSSPYYENIIVDKSIHLIGEDRDTTVIDGNKNGDVVQIHRSFVSMKGFTVENSGQGAWDNGINVWDNHNDVYFSDCILTGNSAGIRFNADSDSYIKNCRFHNNSANSIIVYLASSNISIENCTIDQNGEDGGYSGGIDICGITEQCSNIRITGCFIYKNWWEGISVSRSKNIKIDHNQISDNTYWGIFINGNVRSLFDIIIHDNNIAGNGERQLWFSSGIYLQDCLNCVTVTNNNVVSNKRDGLFLLRSSGNTISENNIMGNARFNAFLQDTEFSFRDNTTLFNHWNGNYWGRPHSLPKPIVGLAWIEVGKSLLIPFPFANIDWHPAKEVIKIT